VTITPFVCQCADMHRMASGRRRVAPSAVQARPKALSSIAFMGLPCPTNSAGSLSPRRSSPAMACLIAVNPVIPIAPSESAAITLRLFIRSSTLSRRRLASKLAPEAVSTRVEADEDAGTR